MPAACAPPCRGKGQAHAVLRKQALRRVGTWTASHAQHTMLWAAATLLVGPCRTLPAPLPANAAPCPHHCSAPQDEADEMLSRGFKDQIYDIFQLLPPKIQVCAVLCVGPAAAACSRHVGGCRHRPAAAAQVPVAFALGLLCCRLVTANVSAAAAAPAPAQRQRPSACPSATVSWLLRT